MLDSLKSLLSLGTYPIPPKTLSIDATSNPRLASTSRPWRVPSVEDALGVPAIQRAVSLIASTTGMLAVQAFRSGELMSDPPRVVVRPDPYRTQGEFYAMSAGQLAKRGELLLWIANRDGDGLASALVVVPPWEVQVQENPDNRLLPIYRWGTRKGTRYSPANPTGEFVHIFYPGAEPFALRGAGPLQLNRAAISVSVEAQEWAANFYADGGYPSTLIKKSGALDPTLRDPTTFEPDPDGMSEADILRAQWVNRPHNVPRVIDETIDSIETKEPNPNGAQMLDSRQHQNGEAARMFGIPGSLLEYMQPGSSLTYQNLEGEFTKFVKVCLKPLYLEPLEQSFSDLLTRSTVVKFDVNDFLQADVKTRFEVHQIAIGSGIYGPDYAQREEGIIPGDPEFVSVPPAAPTAIPLPISTHFSKPGPAPIVTRDQVIAERDRLVAAGLPHGYGSIARELNVSEDTVRRRLAA